MTRISIPDHDKKSNFGKHIRTVPHHELASDLGKTAIQKKGHHRSLSKGIGFSVQQSRGQLNDYAYKATGKYLNVKAENDKYEYLE